MLYVPVHTIHKKTAADRTIQVEDEQKHAQIPTKGGADNAQTAHLEETIFKVSSQLSTISWMQKYFRTRENRNFSTVQSTEARIFNFSLIEVIMMVGMAVLQVLVVRFFFQGARKGEFVSNAHHILCLQNRLRVNEYRDSILGDAATSPMRPTICGGTISRQHLVILS